MMKKLSLAVVVASIALVARPSEARAPLITVTHTTGYDFFATWGTSQVCPGDPGNSWNINTSLNYSEQFNVASLSLGFFNSCNGATTNFSATGETDPNAYPFAFDFKQHAAIDKTIGRDGLIAWATYKASIPVYDSFNQCYLIADVNIRLDAADRAQHMRSLTRSSADGTFTVTFNDFTLRTQTPSGTIALRPFPDGTSCSTDGLPTNFAIYPQVVSDFGDPLTFITKTTDLTITRVRR